MNNPYGHPAPVVLDRLAAAGVRVLRTDRSGLVAEYAGQTGPRTNKKIDEALDGVLFIDEAYSLMAESGDDPYGQESVQAILNIDDKKIPLAFVCLGKPAKGSPKTPREPLAARSHSEIPVFQPPDLPTWRG